MCLYQRACCIAYHVPILRGVCDATSGRELTERLLSQ